MRRYPALLPNHPPICCLSTFFFLYSLSFVFTSFFFLLKNLSKNFVLAAICHIPPRRLNWIPVPAEKKGRVSCFLFLSLLLSFQSVVDAVFDIIINGCLDLSIASCTGIFFPLFFFLGFSTHMLSLSLTPLSLCGWMDG